MNAIIAKNMAPLVILYAQIDPLGAARVWKEHLGAPVRCECGKPDCPLNWDSSRDDKLMSVSIEGWWAFLIVVESQIPLEGKLWIIAYLEAMDKLGPHLKNQGPRFEARYNRWKVNVGIADDTSWEKKFSRN